MKNKLNDKQKKMAYILNVDPELNYSQLQIGYLMGVSQSTISKAKKEVEINNQMNLLKNALAEANAKLLALNNNSNNIIDVDIE